MNNVRVAVVGATGLVGQKMLEVLEERRFPISELIPVASEKSAGKSVSYNGRDYIVQVLSPTVFEGVDIALFSAGAGASKEYGPVAAKSGTVVVDNSSAWRMDPDVPLVVPEVNPEAIKQHKGIIANPNCSTIQMVVALQPLHRRFKIKRVVVSTYQSVSGSGKDAVQQLKEEVQTGQANTKAYPHPIAYNCLPHIDVFFDDGYTKEEHKMILETQKIMGDESIKVSPTTVRVPVFGSHSEAVNLEFALPFDLEEVKEILSSAPGITLQDNPAANVYPMPIEAEDKDDVFVGRIRRDSSIENGLNLWIVSDNLRKGAATNAVQIAEKILEYDSLI